MIYEFLDCYYIFTFVLLLITNNYLLFFVVVWAYTGFELEESHKKRRELFVR